MLSCLMKNNTVKGIRLLYNNCKLREDAEFMREMVDICPSNYLLCLGKACLSPHMAEKGIKVLIKYPNSKEIFEKGPRILLASEKNNKDKFIEKYTRRTRKNE